MERHMTRHTNPFATDPDRSGIWDMLVERDIAAYVSQDWAMVAGDFVEEGFTGVHAHKSPNPDDWTLAFPTLSTYRDEWLRQAAESAATKFAEPLGEGIHRATRLEQIEINAGSAVAHKKFDGKIALADGTFDVLNWQTLYFCRWQDGRWKISGFVGYMAHR
jgi:hypothetical protein